MHKNVIFLMILKLIRLPLSIIYLTLIAKKFGVTTSYDIWILASSAIGVLTLAVWGPINDVFRAKFNIIREEVSEKYAINSTASLVFYMFIISCIVGLVLLVYPQLLGNVIAPNLLSSSKSNLESLIRLLIPLFLISQFCNILSIILNSYEIFYIPEIVGFIVQITNIILVYFFADSLGTLILVVSIYFSNLLLASLLFREIRKLKIINLVSNVSDFSGFKIFFIYAMPLYIPYFIGQLNTLIEKNLANSLNVGTISIIDFSRRIPDLILGVICSVVSIILMPLISKSFATKKLDQFDRYVMDIYGMGIICLGVSTSTFFMIGDSIVKFLFSSKQISVNDQDNILLMTQLYSLSSISIFFYVIFGTVLIAISKNKVNAYLGALAQIFVIVLNFLLVKQYGKIIFPLSVMTSHLIVGLLMLYYYPTSIKRFIVNTVKYILIFLLINLAGINLLKIITLRLDIIDSSSLNFFILLFVVEIYLILSLIFVSRILKTSEYILLSNYISSKIKRI